MTTDQVAQDANSGGYQQGLKLFQRGNIAKAAERLEEVMRQSPDDIRAQYLLGVCYFRLKKFERSEDQFRKSIALDNRHYKAHYYLGLSLERQNRREEALLEYRLTLLIKPDYPEALAKVASGIEKGFRQESPQDKSAELRQRATRDVRKTAKTPSEDMTHTTAGELIKEEKRRKRSFGIHLLMAFAPFVVWPAWIAFNYQVIRLGYLVQITIESSLLLLPATGLVIATLILRSKYTKYIFYERRIDFHYGVLFRKTLSLWYFQIEDILLKRSLINLLTNDAQIHIKAPGLKGNSGPSSFTITGIGNAEYVAQVFDKLRDEAISERHSIKKIWV